MDPGSWPVDVQILLPSTIKQAQRQNNLYRYNFRTASDFYRLHSDFQELWRNIDLVTVDEGHREPAPKWAREVRVLARHTILLAATPYRNDPPGDSLYLYCTAG